jgi:hypothetical protein
MAFNPARKQEILDRLLAFQEEGVQLNRDIREHWTAASKERVLAWFTALIDYMQDNIPEHPRQLHLKAFGMKGTFIAPWQRSADFDNMTNLLEVVRQLIDEVRNS